MKVFITVFSLLFSLPGLAQLYLGPTFGGRLSTVTMFEPRNKDEFNGQPALGFDAGFMVSRRMKEKYCLNAQLMYTQKTKAINGVADPLFKNRQRNHFLELPIAYTIEFKRSVGQDHGGLSKTYNWFVGAGPTVSYWLGGKGKLSSSELSEVFVENLDYKVAFNRNNNELTSETDGNIMNVSDPNRFQFALNFTGGITLQPVGFQKIILAAHLEIGQTLVARKNLGYFPGSEIDFDPQKVKYHSLRISAGYLFDTQIENKKRGKSTIKNKNVSIRKKKR